jgi:hypothetical protein
LKREDINMTRLVPVALALSLCFGSALSAQQRFEERVRITAPAIVKSPVEGWIDRIDAHTLTLTRKQGPAVTLPLGAIVRIERPNGKRWSRLGAAVLGLAAGAVGGNRWGALSAGNCVPRPPVIATGPYGGDIFHGLDCAIGGSISIVMGTVGGGVAGALVGGLLPNQRWTTVPLSSVTPTP